MPLRVFSVTAFYNYFIKSVPRILCMFRIHGLTSLVIIEKLLPTISLAIVSFTLLFPPELPLYCIVPIPGSSVSYPTLCIFCYFVSALLWMFSPDLSPTFLTLCDDSVILLYFLTIRNILLPILEFYHNISYNYLCLELY